MTSFRDEGLRTNILGVRIDALNLEAAVSRVEDWIIRGHQSYVIFRDVHGVMLCQNDQRLRHIHRDAGLVGADGMPLVWLTRWQVGAGVGRVYGPDFMRSFCQKTVGKGYRHYFYGAAPGIAELLILHLQQVAPGIQIAGFMSPPFRRLTREEDAAIVETINAARAHIVWVGLGTPKQEFWMADHLGRLSANALMGVGAAFDFISGNKPQAPIWMQRSGLEWAFRLATEPRRLAKRYLWHVPAFLIRSAAQASCRKRLDIE